MSFPLLALNGTAYACLLNILIMVRM